MEVYGFNIDDFKTLESLLQITTEISNIYNELCKLEIDNQKDSKVYQEQIEKLNKLIEKEKQEYQKKQFSHEDCIKYLKLFEAKTSIPAMDNKVTVSLKYYDDRIIRRIMNNLLSILDQNKGFHQMVINNPNTKEITNMIKEVTEEQLLKGIENATKVQTAIDNDIHSMFLSILEETISYKANAEYKEELIIAKYCILFSHKNMESMFIGYNFNIPNTVYTSSKIINQLLKEPEKTYNFIKHMKLKSIAKFDINVLLNLNDSEYKDHNVFFNSIITACHIRAVLALMEGENVDDFNQAIHAILDSPKYLSKHQNDRISESIIISCFKYFKKDREKVRTLSATN